MFCPGCGTKIEQEARFCPKCGRRLDAVERENADAAKPEKVIITDENNDGKRKASAGKARGVFLGIIFILALALIGMIIVLILQSRESKKENMEDAGWEAIFSESEREEAEADEESVTLQETSESIEEEALEESNSLQEEGTEAAMETEEYFDLADRTVDFFCDYDTPADYANNLELSDYVSYQSQQNADFHFGYPTKLYSYVEVEISESEMWYGSNLETISFYGQDKDSIAKFQLLKRNEAYTMQETTAGLYEMFELQRTDFEKITYNDDSADHGRFVATGYTDETRRVMVYLVTAVYPDSVQIMEIQFPSDGNRESEDFRQKSYVAECMYRMCGFGNSSYRPRTYEQYINGDTGEKY